MCSSVYSVNGGDGPVALAPIVCRMTSIRGIARELYSSTGNNVVGLVSTWRGFGVGYT